MRILLDHCVDWRLKRSLQTHYVKSAQEMGWEDLHNGELLAIAGSDFDVFLTVDQNIKSQQNLANLPLAVVVLLAKSNRTEDLQPLIPVLERVLLTLKLGQLLEIDAAQQVIVVAPGRDRVNRPNQ